MRLRLFSAVLLVAIGLSLGCNKTQIKPAEKPPVVAAEGEEKPPAGHSEHKDHQDQQLGTEPPKKPQ
jgi:hypothetical protein